MARIAYVLPEEIEDSTMRDYLEEAMRNGRPGPENLSIRAHSPPVFRSFMVTRQGFRDESVLSREMRELLRVHIATSLDCPY